jgi:hypothetical protein
LEVLDRAISGHDRLWLVLWQPQVADPTGLITDELEHTYHRLGVGRTFHEIALLLFDVSDGPPLSSGARPTETLAADFGAIQLVGYDLAQRSLKPGDTLYLYLYWTTNDNVEHDYKVFAQILDSSDQIIAQQDQIAGAAEYPTSHWPQGAIVRDRLMLTLASDAQPGSYPLIVGLYRPGTNGPRLAVTGQQAYGDHVRLAEIEIRR